MAKRIREKAAARIENKDNRPYATAKYGCSADFFADLEKSSYQGSLNGPASANGLAADLSAYAGQTVNVTFATVPASDTDSLCIVAHITGITVGE